MRVTAIFLSALLGAGFPWWTFFANVTGCFLMGALIEVLALRFNASNDLRIFLATGILGGYTTFSAFSLQTLSLFQEGAWGRGGAYILASVVLCLMAVWAGYALAVAINEVGK